MCVCLCVFVFACVRLRMSDLRQSCGEKERMRLCVFVREVTKTKLGLVGLGLEYSLWDRPSYWPNIYTTCFEGLKWKRRVGEARIRYMKPLAVVPGGSIAPSLQRPQYLEPVLLSPTRKAWG